MENDDEKILHIQIGDFVIIPFSNGKIYIRYKTGEGGEFSAEGLEKAIATFFWENF